MGWKRGMLRGISADDLPWSSDPSPWPMIGMFGLGLAAGTLIGMVIAAGPAREPVDQAVGWTREQGEQVARRVKDVTA